MARFDHIHTPGYYEPDSGSLAELTALTARRLSAADVPLADHILHNVPVYAMGTLGEALGEAGPRRALMAEWAHVLGAASGVVVLKGACADLGVVDRASAIFREIIARERGAGDGGSDHFAAAGANDRIWNAVQKLCMEDPAAFAEYHANPAIDAICEAWLGPSYQMTAQVNLVRPGGAAQVAHRDYHLGFQTAEVAARFPAHAHALSATMTLQGAVAHGDMPVDSGPTRLLPFSQLFPAGYMAYRRPEIVDFFDENAVQLRLAKGDAVFFNPALFHAAGTNRTADVERMANLLQVSSAMGRAMESVDRDAMCLRLYPVLRDMLAEGRLSDQALAAVVAASAEGYAFPTNLDTDPPKGGLAPESQAALMIRALSHDMPEAEFTAALAAQTARRRA